jgi:hypothetical protein
MGSDEAAPRDDTGVSDLGRGEGEDGVADLMFVISFFFVAWVQTVGLIIHRTWIEDEGNHIAKTGSIIRNKQMVEKLLDFYKYLAGFAG